jgi:exodeoxyribonuclease X
MTTFAVIDFETSSFDDDARVVELASILIDSVLWTDYKWQARFDPGVPITPEASAIHHLTNADVKDQPRFGFGYWIDAVHDADVICAHNAAFDQKFVPSGEAVAPWICTWKCALRAWPDAPGHGNQVLRYWLGLKPDLPKDLYPHCALYDAIVTAGILQKLLETWPEEELIAISFEPALLPKVRFGKKHYGSRWADVPKDYLRWILGQDFDENVRYTARYWLDHR